MICVKPPTRNSQTGCLHRPSTTLHPTLNSMEQHSEPLAKGRTQPVHTGRTGLRKLLACLALPCLLGACSSMIASGMVLEHAVAYPMRSPEYVLRELGDNRYLLGQWVVPLNANSVLRVRYYDRRTGMLSPLPGNVAVYREGYVANILGTVRYESDSPQQIAYFADRYTGYDSYCKQPDKSTAGKPAGHHCGHMDIVLSLDGGHSFALRRISTPTSVGRARISPQNYEFAMVRNNTLYLGLYVDTVYISEICCHSADQNLVDKNGVAYVRRLKGEAVADSKNVFLGVLAVPLPNNGDTPLPAKQIPQNLSADMLTGQALLTFDLGQPMARLATPPRTGPKPPSGQYKRADREAYIESLRAEYPEWAAHQTLDDIPWRTQWMTSEETNALRAKQTPHGYDPVEWVRFDRPAAK